ncbi:MAG TPA: hypothetical protein VNL77_21080, partial [Roseiflexaceae bacterium]|nr:hypothetical protein [Roseiflexaceae bacterium]
GDVRLRLSTPPLQGLPDPRTLGVVLYQVRVAPAGGLPRAPAPGMLALLAAALAGIFALVSRLAGPLPRRHEGTKARRTHAVFVSSRPRVFVVSACILIAAYLLAARRADLTIFAPVLAGLVWACYLLAVLLMPLLTAATRRLRVAAGERECGGAVAATVAAFGLRMGGMLHPYHRFSDTGLHVNNLLGVTLRGALFFTEGLPCEAGGGQSPYPPGPYLALAPGALLTGADRPLQTLLLQGGVALLESCSAALVWLLLRRCRVDRAAALLGAALYAFAPPLLRAYAVGEMANLFAQALLLPLLLFLALGAPQAGRPGVTALGTALLAALLLSHTGAAISTAALLAAWLVLRWLGTVRASGATRTHAHEGWANSFAKGVRPFEPPTWPLLLTAVLAVAVAGLLYYSAYLGLFVERRALAAAQAGLPAAERCPVGYPLGQKLYGWVIAPLASPQPALAAPLLAAGAAGMLLMVVPCAERPGARYGARHALGLALAACWLGALLSFATLLTSDQAVRWQPFLFPALCLGGGLALAAWRRHGQAGRTLAYAALGYLAWYAVSDWVRLIGTYLH